MANRNNKIELPVSKSAFLNDILESIKKRSKALKNRTSDFSCERVLVEDEGERLEKLELVMQPAHSSSKKAPLSLDIWEDRWIHITFCEWKNNTWDWSWSYEGNLLPIYDGLIFEAAIEATLMTAFQMEQSKIHEFDEIWKPLLARGPELVG